MTNDAPIPESRPGFMLFESLAGDPAGIRRARQIGLHLGLPDIPADWTESQVAAVRRLLSAKMPMDGARKAVR